MPGCSSACRRRKLAKREYVKSGDRFIEQGKLAEAIVQYRNALQQDAQFGDARYKLAEAYEKIGDARNAYREHIRAADAFPDNVEVQVKAGFYLLLAGQFEEARARAMKALKKDPHNADAQVLLGNSLAGLKDFSAALKELEAAVRLDPKSASAYTSLGTVQLRRARTRTPKARFGRPSPPTRSCRARGWRWRISVGRRPSR